METNYFRDELKALINRYSKENGSNTPDFILAEFLDEMLKLFDATVIKRQKWFASANKPSTKK